MNCWAKNLIIWNTLFISSASKVLACHLCEPSFARTFIEHSSTSIDFLKCLASECSAGERLRAVEAQCHARRMLYRDCAKPPPPPTKSQPRPVSGFGLNIFMQKKMDWV